jgi:hypothetical protein
MSAPAVLQPTPRHTVAIGDVYLDRDPRTNGGRKIKIDSVGKIYGNGLVIGTGRRTSIKISRLLNPRLFERVPS